MLHRGWKTSTRIVGLLVGFLVAVGPVWAQGGPGPSAPAGATTTSGMDPLLAELLERNRARNFAMPTSTLPGASLGGLYGDLATGTAGSTQQTLREFLTRYGSLLGFPAGADPMAGLAELSRRSGDAGLTVIWAPASNGVPYIRGGLVTTFDSSGKLVGVSGRYRSMAGAQMGSLTPEAAARRAFQDVQRRFNGATLTGDGDVREFLDDAAGGLAHRYQVDLVVGRPPTQQSILLDQAGNVISAEDGTLDATGRVMPTYPTVDTADRDLPSILSPRLLWPLIGVASFFVDYRVKGTYFWSDSSYPESAHDGDGRFVYEPFAGDTEHPSKANPLFLEANVYYHLMVAHDRVIEWGAEEANDHHFVEFDVWRPARKSWRETRDFRNNAMFVPADTRFEFAAENPRYDERSPGMDASIAYHEYGHYVHRCLSGNYRTGGSAADRTEAAAISEGFGDALAACITSDSRKSFWWKGGEDYRSSENTLTTTEVTPCYNGARPDGFTSHQEVHFAGQVFSGAVWDLKGRVGAADAMKIVISGLRKARTPHTFVTVAQGMLDADQELNGGRHNATLVEILSRRRMMPAPVRATGS